MSRIIVLLVAASSACGQDDPPALTAAEWFCDGLCEAQVRCETGNDRTRCHAACLETRPGLVNFSPQGAEAYASCIRALDCNDFYSDQAFEACWTRAQGDIAPTQYVRGFCREFSSAFYECGYSLSTEECESIYGMWAEPVLDRVNQCLAEETCAELEACTASVFESF